MTLAPTDELALVKPTLAGDVGCFDTLAVQVASRWMLVTSGFATNFCTAQWTIKAPSGARSSVAVQGLMRRQSAMLDTSGAATNWRRKAARVLRVSQTNSASVRLSRCRRCGCERGRSNWSMNAHNGSELCKIWVSTVGPPVGTGNTTLPRAPQESCHAQLTFRQSPEPKLISFAVG